MNLYIMGLKTRGTSREGRRTTKFAEGRNKKLRMAGELKKVHAHIDLVEGMNVRVRTEGKKGGRSVPAQ